MRNERFTNNSNQKKGKKDMNKTIVQIVKSGNRFNAWDIDGVKFTSQISNSTRKGAYLNKMALEQKVNKNGKAFWSRVPMSEFESTTAPVIDVSSVDVPTEHAEVLNFIHSSYNLKPQGLVMKELKWKYLVRSAVRGKNILMVLPDVVKLWRLSHWLTL